MKTLRVVRIGFAVFALALFLIGGGAGLLHVVHAQQKQPPITIQIPKSWGQLRNATSATLFLEASDGTIRVYDLNSKELKAEISRR